MKAKYRYREKNDFLKALVLKANNCKLIILINN